jgi:hypothetical protein
MNERILKLAREAALAEGWGPGVWQTTFTEKFAELIVKECANRATWAQDTSAADIGGEVLKHFGVEE